MFSKIKVTNHFNSKIRNLGVIWTSQLLLLHLPYQIYHFLFSQLNSDSYLCIPLYPYFHYLDSKSASEATQYLLLSCCIHLAANTVKLKNEGIGLLFFFKSPNWLYRRSPWPYIFYKPKLSLFPSLLHWCLSLNPHKAKANYIKLNNGNSDRLYFGGLQYYCRWWLQPWN